VLLLVNTLPFLEEDLSLTEEASSTLSPAKEPLNLLAFLASLRFKFFPNSHTSALVEIGDTRKQGEQGEQGEKFPVSPRHRVSVSSSSPLAPHPSLSRNRPVIRGIATQRSSRTLVLVTAQNEILDILTPQQQQRLQERIIGEVAKYWRYQRLAHSVEQQRTTGLPLLFKRHNTGERETEEFTHRPITPYQVLTFLDRTIAEVESNHLAPVSEVAKTSLSFPSTVGKRSWKLVQQLQIQLSRSLSSSKSPAITPDAETHTLRIQALIWAAIDYFFGRSRKHLKQTTLHLPTGSKPQGKPLPHRRPAAKLSSTWSPPSPHDPWLTLSDLFGDSAESDEPSTLHQPKLSKSQTINKVSSASEISAQPDTQSTQLESAPDWIETNATSMGYVKHPLEKLLAWLDRAMFWLEQVLIKVWRWVKNSFK
jgi:hypothetical protein